MKRRCFTLLLAALLLASLLPASALPVSAATETINTVSVRAITPFAGQHPVFESKNYSEITERKAHPGYDIHTYTDAESGWKNGVMWLDRNGNVMTESDTFEAYQTYEVLVLVYAKEGYAFPKSPGTNVTAKVNDLAAKAATVGAGLKNGKDVIAIRYTFSCLKEKILLSEIEVEFDMSQIEEILVEGGTLREVECTVIKGGNVKISTRWEYSETGEGDWTYAYWNSRVKLGFYRLYLEAIIWDEHLEEVYYFPEVVSFTLNGVTGSMHVGTWVDHGWYLVCRSYEVTTEEIIDSVTISPRDMTLSPGDSQQFTATVLPSTVKEKGVTWYMSGGNGGTTLSANGLLTIGAEQRAGLLQIYAYSKMDSRVYDYVIVTVELPESARTPIEDVSLLTYVPLAGEHPNYEAEDYGNNSEKYGIHAYTDAESGWKDGVMWLDRNGNVMTESDTFEAYQTYEVLVLVYAKLGYIFPKDPGTNVEAMINCNTAKAASVGAGLKQGKDVIAIRYTYSCLKEKIKITEAGVDMDMSQFADILVQGKTLKNPTFTVTRGIGPEYNLNWYYLEEGGYKAVKEGSTVKPGTYKVYMEVSIWSEYLYRTYSFPKEVPFYLNGVNIASLRYDILRFDSVCLGEFTVPEGISGDVDADGDKDTNDAVYLLLHVMFGATDYPI